jgi:uncharacterized protein (TIGR02285 family)
MQHVVFLLLFFGTTTLCFATESDNTLIIFSSSSGHEQAGPEPIVFDYLKSNLTTYKIKQVHAGLERSQQLLTNLSEGCVRNLVKNPTREQFFDFSLPETLFLGVKAYLSPRAATLVADTQVDTIELVNFAKQHKLVVGIDKERSYGFEIDAELAKLPAANKYVKEGIESEDRMARMLFSNRVDLLLEYQTVMDIFLSTYLTDDKLQSYYVSGAQRYVYSHLACKKTQNSSKLISEVNQLLRNLYKEPVYYQSHVQFISANLHDNFDAMFTEFLSEYTATDMHP